MCLYLEHGTTTEKKLEYTSSTCYKTQEHKMYQCVLSNRTSVILMKVCRILVNLYLDLNM